MQFITKLFTVRLIPFVYIQVSAYPGQVFSLNVTGIDEFRQPVTLAVRVSDVSIIIKLLL